MSKPRHALLIVAIALIGGACTAASSGTPAPSGSVDLQGAWELAEGTGPDGAIPVVDGARITLVVDGTSVSGQSACNLYGGSVAVAGDRVRFDRLAGTEMGCEPPIMASEAAFLGAIAGVTGAVRDGDALTLGGPAVELRFVLQPPVPVAEIIDTEWLLETLVSGDVAQSVNGRPTLKLGSDGSLAASTGCRELTGAYVISGDEVVVTDLAADGDCPVDLAAQDQAVLDVLEGSFTARVEGQQLTLGSNGSLGLVYRATE